jgi:uncharacterized protein (TIGR00251 family)
VIDVEAHNEGCIVLVRAQPGARRNCVTGICNRQLKVAVTAPPDKGKANDALVEVIAEALNVKRSQVELISGRGSRVKKFLIRGTTIADVIRKVTEFFGAVGFS